MKYSFCASLRAEGSNTGIFRNKFCNIRDMIGTDCFFSKYGFRLYFTRLNPFIRRYCGDFYFPRHFGNC
ncbi:hypothetical protein EDC20_1622 [Gluconobacter oxydans]|nr:hypothetical protein EDC20_1622 [Gluconobacter oxydans]